MKTWPYVLAACLLAACGPHRQKVELHAAAASNLERVFEPLAQAFEKSTGIAVIPTYAGSTTLAQQLENGGPFDIFLSADSAQIDRLVAKGVIDPPTRAMYAQGVLALWAPKRPDIVRVEDLTRNGVKRVAVANPELSPYGKAALETLNSLKLWPVVEPKVVYGPNISVVAQFAESSNADASFTALSLVNDRLEKPVIVPENLYSPLMQSLGIVKASAHIKEATTFRQFLLGPEGQAIFAKFGYKTPNQSR